jgi:hypothetical protein
MAAAGEPPGRYTPAELRALVDAEPARPDTVTIR